MKTLLSLLLIASTAICGDTLSVARPAVVNNLIRQRDEAERKLNASFTIDQMRMKEKISELNGAIKFGAAIAQDTIKVKK